MINAYHVLKVIVMSASANKLGKLKGHAATYASLIMEELDLEKLGYIQVFREALFLLKTLKQLCSNMVFLD